MNLTWEQGHDWRYRIGWGYGGYIEGVLGQSPRDGLGSRPKRRDALEHWTACAAILDADPDIARDSTGFYWTSKASMLVALRAARAAVNTLEATKR